MLELVRALSRAKYPVNRIKAAFRNVCNLYEFGSTFSDRRGAVGGVMLCGFQWVDVARLRLVCRGRLCEDVFFGHLLFTVHLQSSMLQNVFLMSSSPNPGRTQITTSTRISTLSLVITGWGSISMVCSLILAHCSQPIPRSRMRRCSRSLCTGTGIRLSSQASM